MASPTVSNPSPTQQQPRIDQEALLLMLSYIEAECARLGARESARHAALAAALLPQQREADPAMLRQ